MSDEPLNEPLYTRPSQLLLVIFSQLVLDELRHYMIFSPEFCLRISFQWIFFYNLCYDKRHFSYL